MSLLGRRAPCHVATNVAALHLDNDPIEVVSRDVREPGEEAVLRVQEIMSQSGQPILIDEQAGDHQDRLVVAPRRRMRRNRPDISCFVEIANPHRNPEYNYGHPKVAIGSAARISPGQHVALLHPR